MTVALADNALTTLAILKEDLGIAVSTWDDQLNRIINYASAAVEKHCNRIFYRDTEIEELVRGYGWESMRVSRTPVNEITSIAYDGSTLDSDSYTLVYPAAGIIEKAGGWIWTAHSADDISQGPLPGTERYLYTVTYDGGWYTPKQYDDDNNNTMALPWDIEEACLEIARQAWFVKKRDPSITAEKLMDWNASYGNAGGTGLSPHVRKLLAPYRRLA